MKKYQNLFSVILFSVVLCWFVSTIFIDFFAVPSVFRTVTSRDDAAMLGITIFSKYNIFELIFLLLILTFGHFSYQTGLLKKLACLALAIFPVTYMSYLTPNIKKYNALKVNSAESEAMMLQIQEQLDFYHQTYVRMDSVKLLVLLILIVTVFLEIYKLHLNKVEGHS